MSDHDDEPIKGGSFDWAQLGRGCANMVEKIEDEVGRMSGAPEGHTSWQHTVGVGFILLQRSMTMSKLPPDAVRWLHERLAILHEGSHAYMDGGPEATRQFFELVARAHRQEGEEGLPAEPGPACPPGTHLH